MQCGAEELAELIANGRAPHLLDVRNEDEFQYAHIEGSQHIPMNEIPARIGELESLRNADLIVICHHGIRSERVRQFLAQQGFSRARNLSGGIDAWAERIDPEMARY